VAAFRAGLIQAQATQVVVTLLAGQIFGKQAACMKCYTSSKKPRASAVFDLQISANPKSRELNSENPARAGNAITASKTPLKNRPGQSAGHDIDDDPGVMQLSDSSKRWGRYDART
jgi:hypothetical protein